MTERLFKCQYCKSVVALEEREVKGFTCPTCRALPPHAYIPARAAGPLVPVKGVAYFEIEIKKEPEAT